MSCWVQAHQQPPNCKTRCSYEKRWPMRLPVSVLFSVGIIISYMPLERAYAQQSDVANIQSALSAPNDKISQPPPAGASAASVAVAPTNPTDKTRPATSSKTVPAKLEEAGIKPRD